MTNTTTTPTPDNPDYPSIDFRTIPNWAIPQLAYIRDTLGATILTTFIPINDADLPTTPLTARLGFTLHIWGEGTYIGAIYKKDMGAKFIPGLFGRSY